MFRVLQQLILALTLFTYAATGQTGTSLSLTSGPIDSAGTASLNLNLASATGSQPTAIQWTFSYPATSITAISATVSPSVAAAGKSLSCLASIGSYTCLLMGMNTAVIPNGTIVTLNVAAAPARFDRRY